MIRTSNQKRWQDRLFNASAIPNVVILVTITLQLIPFFFDWRLFPFIEYPMYSAAVGPGPWLAVRSKVFLQTRSGKQRQFLPQAGQELSRSVAVYGLSQTTYQRHYLIPMIADCKGTAAVAAARELGDRINRKAEDPIVQIELQAEIYRSTEGHIEMTESYTCLFEVSTKD